MARSSSGVLAIWPGVAVATVAMLCPAAISARLLRRDATCCTARSRSMATLDIATADSSASC